MIWTGKRIRNPWKFVSNSTQQEIEADEQDQEMIEDLHDDAEDTADITKQV